MILYSKNIHGLSLFNTLHRIKLENPNLEIDLRNDIDQIPDDKTLIFYEIDLLEHINYDIIWSDLTKTHEQNIALQVSNLRDGIGTVIPPILIKKLRTGSAYLILSFLMENYMGMDFIEIIAQHLNLKGIPLEKVIYLTNTVNSKELFLKECVDRAVKPKINIEGFPYFLLSLYNLSFEFGSGITNYTVDSKQKPFMCLNRRFRNHRGIFYLMIYANNLLDNFYYSLDQIDPDSRLPNVTDKVKSTTARDFLKGCLFSNYIDPNQFSDQVLDNAINQLPLILDTATFEYPNKENKDLITYFENSLISVVTETNFNDNIHLTEKIFRAMYNLHPFILLSSHGSLKYLRSLGFITFNIFWDESYDDESHHGRRIEKVLNLVKEISTWSQERRFQFSMSVQPILEHNKKLVINSVHFSKKYIDHLRSSYT